LRLLLEAPAGFVGSHLPAGWKATEKVDGGVHRLQKHLIPSSSDGGSFLAG
jgi:hypothetical protein